MLKPVGGELAYRQYLIDGVYDPRATHKELKAAQAEAGYGAMSEVDLIKEIRRLEKEMLEHARNLEFEQAARVRDQLSLLREQAFGASTGDGNVVPIDSARGAS